MSDEPRPGQSIDHKTASGDPPGDDPGNSSAGQPINPPELPLQPGRKGGRWWLWKLLPVALLLAVGLVLIVTLGVAQRTGWITAGGGRTGGASAEEGVIYTCPMHPQIRQPTPGKCPICRMVLVPAVASGGNLEQMAVTIEPAQRRLAGIETAPAVLEPVLTRVETIGEVMIDESLIATVPAYVAGRIEELFADYTGVEVEKGDHLAVLYSPNLYSAQVEYLEARRAVESTSSAGLESVRRVQERLVTSSRQRLVELGMAAEQIQTLEQSGKAKSRLTIYTPIGGTVVEKLVEEGKSVATGEPIYRVADLRTVWLMLELFPEDAARIRFGQQVEAELQSLPGEKFTGRVAFIDPTVDRVKRTVGVRVEFRNDRGQLRPGDYAQAQILVPLGEQGEVYDAGLAGKWISPMHPQVIREEPGDCPICGMKLVPASRYGYSDQPVLQSESLTVPRSAVLMAGAHSVVYVETKPGRFELRNVTLGSILRDRIVILSGVQPGEQVATAGNFLIDSQMQLAGNPSLIDPTKAAPAEEEQSGPLKIEHVHVTPVEGETGQQLEQVYDIYFRIQQTLAADKRPREEDAVQLHRLATELKTSETLPETTRTLLEEIATRSEHLHHLELEQARLEAFRPLSQAVVRLAAQARGSQAKAASYHMFCPMVPGGQGDWLQRNDKLRNPYWGSQMLTCGDVVQQLPPSGHVDGNEAEADSPPQPSPADTPSPSTPAQEN